MNCYDINVTSTLAHVVPGGHPPGSRICIDLAKALVGGGGSKGLFPKSISLVWSATIAKASITSATCPGPRKREIPRVAPLAA